MRWQQIRLVLENFIQTYDHSLNCHIVTKRIMFLPENKNTDVFNQAQIALLCHQSNLSINSNRKYYKYYYKRNETKL